VVSLRAMALVRFADPAHPAHAADRAAGGAP
jgi:hypothetical protein